MDPVSLSGDYCWIAADKALGNRAVVKDTISFVLENKNVFQFEGVPSA